uniref:Uncharacterized protein n=1 Tax=Daucus carota subsp. sativus TaxID=79200 RepID=A0A175YJL2_DAUCS
MFVGLPVPEWERSSKLQIKNRKFGLGFGVSKQVGVERGLPRDSYAGGSRTLSVGTTQDFGGHKSYGPGGDGAISDPGGSGGSNGGPGSAPIVIPKSIMRDELVQAPPQPNPRVPFFSDHTLRLCGKNGLYLDAARKRERSPELQIKNRKFGLGFRVSKQVGVKTALPRGSYAGGSRTLSKQVGVERGLPRDCYAGGSRTLSVGASHDFGGKKSYGPGGDGATSDPGGSGGSNGGPGSAPIVFSKSIMRDELVQAPPQPNPRVPFFSDHTLRLCGKNGLYLDAARKRERSLELQIRNRKFGLGFQVSKQVGVKTALPRGSYAGGSRTLSKQVGVERGLPRDCYAGGSRTLSVGASHDFGGKKSYGPGGDGATSDPGGSGGSNGGPAVLAVPFFSDHTLRLCGKNGLYLDAARERERSPELQIRNRKFGLGFRVSKQVGVKTALPRGSYAGGSRTLSKQVGVKRALPRDSYAGGSRTLSEQVGVERGLPRDCYAGGSRTLSVGASHDFEGHKSYGPGADGGGCGADADADGGGCGAEQQ